MTESEVKVLLGPHPSNLAMRRMTPIIFLIALIALLFFIGGDTLPFVLLLCIPAPFLFAICVGASIGTLAHIPTYNYLLAHLQEGELSPGYVLGAFHCGKYILIDKENDTIMLDKQTRKISELRNIEYRTGKKEAVIEFIFNSGDEPIVKCSILSKDNAKKEFMKINNYLGFSTN